MKLVRQESTSLVLFELTTLRSNLECQVPIFPVHLPVCQGRGRECCWGVKTRRAAQSPPHRGRPETSVNYVQATEAVCPKRGGVVGVPNVTHVQRGQRIYVTTSPWVEMEEELLRKWRAAVFTEFLVQNTKQGASCYLSDSTAANKGFSLPC